MYLKLCTNKSFKIILYKHKDVNTLNHITLTKLLERISYRSINSTIQDNKLV